MKQGRGQRPAHSGAAAFRLAKILLTAANLPDLGRQELVLVFEVLARLFRERELEANFVLCFMAHEGSLT
jgi:hypothetical protein